MLDLSKYAVNDDSIDEEDTSWVDRQITLKLINEAEDDLVLEIRDRFLQLKLDLGLVQCWGVLG